MTDDEIAVAIGSLISPLAPKDLKRFAEWGMPEHQTTADKCWD